MPSVIYRTRDIGRFAADNFTSDPMRQIWGEVQYKWASLTEEPVFLELATIFIRYMDKEPRNGQD